MKTLYIAPKSVWFEHLWNMHPSHYLDLPGGLVAARGEFHDSGQEQKFLAAGAKSVPHICPSVPMPAELVPVLAHLGITESDSTFSAHQKLAAIHPLL